MNAANPPEPPSSRQSLSDGSAEEATPPAQFWRSRNVLLLLTARSVSVAGDWLFNIALVRLVLQTTHSARMVAAVSIAQAVPVIAFGVFYAGILDRVRSRRQALVVIDVARAMIVLAYPLLQAGNLLNPVTLIMASVALGAANAVFNPGLQSLLPDVLATSDLPRAHAMLDVTQRLGRILGPGLSGLLLLLVTTSDFFYIDSGGYLISAVGLAGLAVRVQRSPKAGAAQSRAGSRFHDLRASVGYLRTAPVSRRLIIVRTVQNGLWAVYTVGLPLLVYQSFGQTPGVFGVLVGVYAVGQLIGNFLAVQASWIHPSTTKPAWRVDPVWIRIRHSWSQPHSCAGRRRTGCQRHRKRRSQHRQRRLSGSHDKPAHTRTRLHSSINRDDTGPNFGKRCLRHILRQGIA